MPQGLMQENSRFKKILELVLMYVIIYIVS